MTDYDNTVLEECMTIFEIEMKLTSTLERVTLVLMISNRYSREYLS